MILMNKSQWSCVFFGLMTYLSSANALPVFSHTVDDGGLYTISVDGSQEPLFVGLDVDAINGTALGDDLGTNYEDSFFVLDNNSDRMLTFTFSNTNNITELTGFATYANEGRTAFTYGLESDVIEPPVAPPEPEPMPSPTPSNVPEPPTFLLLGFGLLGIAGTRLFRIKSLSNQQRPLSKA
jgi:hypothetical protein